MLPRENFTLGTRDSVSQTITNGEKELRRKIGKERRDGTLRSTTSSQNRPRLSNYIEAPIASLIFIE